MVNQPSFTPVAFPPPPPPTPPAPPPQHRPGPPAAGVVLTGPGDGGRSAAAAPPAMVRLVGLVKRYGATTALAGVDLTIGRGETVAVMGPSGSGKTTLALCAAGLVIPDEGQVFLGGERIDDRSEGARSALRLTRIGLVFQAGHLLTDLTAVENAALPLLFTGTPRRRAVAEAGRWFEPLGLAGLERRRPGELSGGQAQRVAIVRAIVGRPELLIADEPTAALDRAASGSAMQLLTWLTAELGATLVVVTHDSAVAAACGRHIEIEDGRITADRRSTP